MEEKLTKPYLIIKGRLIHKGESHAEGVTVHLAAEDAAHPLKYGIIADPEADAEAAAQAAKDLESGDELTPVQLAKLTNAQLIEYALDHHELKIKPATKKDEILFEIKTAVKKAAKAAKAAAEAPAE